MLVLSVVIGLNTVVDSLEILGAVLLAGMGLVFLLLPVLGPEQVQWWPIIPGLVLALFGAFIFSGGNEADSALLRLVAAASDCDWPGHGVAGHGAYTQAREACRQRRAWQRRFVKAGCLIICDACAQKSPAYWENTRRLHRGPASK